MTNLRVQVSQFRLSGAWLLLRRLGFVDLLVVLATLGSLGFVVVALLADVPAASIGAIAGTGLTVLYVALTYGLLRAQHEDRRYAARPFIWAYLEKSDAGVVLILENRSQLPAFRVRTLVDFTVRVDIAPGSTTKSHLSTATVGGLPSSGGRVQLKYELCTFALLEVYLLMDTHLGHACAAYYSFTEVGSNLGLVDVYMSHPGRRRDIEQRSADVYPAARASGFLRTIDSLALLGLPPNLESGLRSLRRRVADGDIVVLAETVYLPPLIGQVSDV